MAIINQVIVMSLLTAVGFLCYKIKLINEQAIKSMSAILLNFATSAVILVSYQKEFEQTLFRGLIISFVCAIIAYIIMFLLVPFLIHNKDKDKLKIDRFSCIYTNCAFMGIPLIQGVYGSDGVFYLTAFITLFNLLVWTHGQMYLKGEFSPKSALKAFASPALIATVVGLVLFMANIIFPAPIINTIQQLANLNTPLAMLVAGATIAKTDLLSAIKKPKLYYISFVKLIFLPLIIMIVFRIFNIDQIVGGVNMLAAACPSATICTLFAIQYNKDSVYASEIFAATTLLSMITLPLLTFFYNFLYTI